MKHIILLHFCMLVGCSSHNARLQSVNGESMLLGNVTQNELLNSVTAFRDNYKNFSPSDSITQFVRHYKDTLQIEIFFGSWCGDSKRNLPPFLKIFDMANNPKVTLALHGLDRTKIDSASGTDKFHIKRVPTLVFIRNNVELTRFTESPQKDIESDLINFLRNEIQ